MQSHHHHQKRTRAKVHVRSSITKQQTHGWNEAIERVCGSVEQWNLCTVAAIAAERVLRMQRIMIKRTTVWLHQQRRMVLSNCLELSACLCAKKHATTIKQHDEDEQTDKEPQRRAFWKYAARGTAISPWTVILDSAMLLPKPLCLSLESRVLH